MCVYICIYIYIYIHVTIEIMGFENQTWAYTVVETSSMARSIQGPRDPLNPGDLTYALSKCTMKYRYAIYPPVCNQNWKINIFRSRICTVPTVYVYVYMYVYIHKQRDKLIYIHIIDDSNALLAGTDIRLSQCHAPSLSHILSQIGNHSSNSLAPTGVVFSVPHIQLDQKQSIASMFKP